LLRRTSHPLFMIPFNGTEHWRNDLGYSFKAFDGSQTLVELNVQPAK
jgi:hypothetical protein